MAISQQGTAVLTDPQHWRDRAEEARLLAQDMNDPQSKAAMLRIAQDYERLAERAQQMAKVRQS